MDIIENNSNFGSSIYKNIIYDYYYYSYGSLGKIIISSFFTIYEPKDNLCIANNIIKAPKYHIPHSIHGIILSQFLQAFFIVIMTLMNLNRTFIWILLGLLGSLFSMLLHKKITNLEIYIMKNFPQFYDQYIQQKIDFIKNQNKYYGISLMFLAIFIVLLSIIFKYFNFKSFRLY